MESKNCLKLCDEKIECGVTVAVVGRLNSGKSMLVSSLLEWEIVLPSSDEATTGRITRFVYSQTPIIRTVKTGQWDENGRCYEYEESVLSEDDALNEDNLSDYIHLSQEDRSNVESLSTIIEIGIPSEVLKSGLKIIDCPGLDENQLMSTIEEEILRKMISLILVYVYNHKQGFSLRDGEILRRLALQFDSLEILTIANKCDSFDDSFSDSIQEDSIQLLFNESQANATIRQNAPWQYDMTFASVDKDRLLPILPLSTGKLFFSLSSEDNEDDRECRTMFKNLKYQMASKIISQSRSILTVLICRVQTESNLNLYFLLHSLSVEDDLKELMIRECSDDRNLLVDFSGGYKVFGVRYRGEEIHVTTLSNNTQIDYQQEKRRIRFDRIRSQIIYENEDQSMLYLIAKEKSRKRLIDHLNEFTLQQMLKQLNYWFENNFRGITMTFDFPTFRPDNVYLDKNGSISVNQTVPNHPNLSFILKDGQEIPPFHLHPHLKEKYSEFYKDRYQFDISQQLRNIQNLYSLGWFIWMLIDGGSDREWIDPTDLDVNERIQLLQQGRFPDYPKDLDEVMKLCWNLSIEDDSFLLFDKKKEIEVYLRIIVRKFCI